jgi:hypothetical protein
MWKKVCVSSTLSNSANVDYHMMKRSKGLIGRAGAPCCVLRAASATLARASSLVRLLFDFHILRHSCHHRAPQGAHPPPSLRRAVPAPPLRISASTAAPSAPPPCATTPPTPTSRPARHSASTTPRGCPLRARDVGGCVLAQRPAAQSLLGTTPPARFCAASRPDARCSSAPSAPCWLSSVQVRHGTAGKAGRGGPLRVCSQLARARGLGLAAQRGALNGVFWEGCALVTGGRRGCGAGVCALCGRCES